MWGLRIMLVFLWEQRTLIEDIRAFNKEYIGELKLKKEFDGKVFIATENSFTSFHYSLSKFNFLSTTSISQEQILHVVTSVESCLNLNWHQSWILFFDYPPMFHAHL